MIPPLSPDEYRQLEENILAEGIRDPLVVWEVPNGDMILLDGHNRFEIAAKHGGIHFEVKKMHFSGNDREQAIVWICDNQLGRRNLQLPDKILLSDKRTDALSKIAKDKMLSGKEDPNKKSWQGEGKTERQIRRENSTDYKIAKAAGTSEDTVRKSREINRKTPDAIQRIKNGDQSINSAWLEIKERERKQEDLSAKAHLEKAKDRHEDFQSAKTVTMSDIAQDRKDSAEIASGKSREITNALKGILFIGAAMSSGDADYSIINQKNMSTEEIRTLTNKITQAISILTSIRESIGR